MEERKGKDSLEGAAWTIDELRLRLREIHREEMERFERAEAERMRLGVLREPEKLHAKRSHRETKIRCEVIADTKYTPEEWALLMRYSEEQKALNPLVRSSARHAEFEIVEQHHQRLESAVQKAIQDFRRCEFPCMCKDHEAEERRYDEYVMKAFALEDEMKTASRAAREVFALDDDLTLIQRAGITRIEGIGEKASFGDVDVAIRRCYASISAGTQRMIERQLKRELGQQAKAFGWDAIEL